MTSFTKPVRKRRRHYSAFDITVIIILTLLTILIAFPIWISLVSSFSTEAAYIMNPLQLLPAKWTISNYAYIIEKCDLLTAYGNSVLNTVLCVSYGLLCTITMAYAFSYREFPGRTFFYSLLIITMFFGGGLIPDYLLAKNLKLINTRWAAVLWGGVGAYNVIIIRNNIESIPTEIKEAAYIDGANEIKTFSRIILPLLKPTLATFTLFFAVAAWNDYFWPMLMLQKNALRTLPLMLRTLIVTDTMDTSNLNASISDELRAFTEGIKMAGVIVTMLPVMCVYPFLQKHFAKGMLVGSLKM